MQCALIASRQVNMLQPLSTRYYSSLLLYNMDVPDRISELIFGSRKNMPDETNTINNADSCNKEAVQFSASFVTSLFASFWRNLWNSNKFCIFFVRVTKLINIANSSADRSAMIVLSIFNWKYRHPPNLVRNLAGDGLGQISEKWAGFRICRSWNLVQT